MYDVIINLLYYIILLYYIYFQNGVITTMYIRSIFIIHKLDGNIESKLLFILLYNTNTVLSVLLLPFLLLLNLFNHYVSVYYFPIICILIRVVDAVDFNRSTFR